MNTNRHCVTMDDIEADTARWTTWLQDLSMDVGDAETSWRNVGRYGRWCAALRPRFSKSENIQVVIANKPVDGCRIVDSRRTV